MPRCSRTRPVARRARCESCHNNPKALGYGISGGRFLQGLRERLHRRSGDRRRADHPAADRRCKSQPIPKLDHDLSRIVTEDGEQLVTVGSHWPLTGPLPQEMREKMERTGLCMGCHQNMTDEDLWSEVNTPGFVNNEEHQKVLDAALRAYAETNPVAAAQ